MMSEASNHPVLQAALDAGTPRFFRAAGGEAMGRTGPEDTERFAEHLMVLQECALLLGEKLSMNAVSYAIVQEGQEMAGFCFDPNTSPHDPEVAGALVNQSMPVAEFLAALHHYINE